MCSSKEPTYKYCDKDLISNPTKYQYTAFEGPTFLISYRNRREEFLRKIKKKLYHSSELLTPSQKKKIKTNQKLAKFIISHVKENLAEDKIDLWADCLSIELDTKDYYEMTQ